MKLQFNSITTVEVCDATMLNGSSAAGYPKITLIRCVTFLISRNEQTKSEEVLINKVIQNKKASRFKNFRDALYAIFNSNCCQSSLSLFW